jgi:hypothetical protein
VLTDGEHHAGEHRAQPNVPPVHLHVGQELEDHPEEHRGEGEEHRLVEQLAPALIALPPQLAHGVQRHAGEQRDEQQKADAQHHRQREHARAEESEDARDLQLGRLPDDVERFLQRGEDAGGAEERGHGSQDRRQGALLLAAGTLDHRLDGLGARLADHSREVLAHFALRRFATEEQAGDGDGDQQQRRDGKERVVRQRGGHRRSVVVTDRCSGLLAQSHQLSNEATHDESPLPPKRPAPRSAESVWSEAPALGVALF